YVYLLFESEAGVRALLQSCRQFGNDDRYALDLCPMASHLDAPFKKVEVVPWNVADARFGLNPFEVLEPGLSVFVGALHGTITARGLAQVLNDLFGGVVYVGIDTDKDLYPIGSGRAMFGNRMSYMKAVEAEFVQITTPKFIRKIQIDPYLEGKVLCQTCNIELGTKFCRNTVTLVHFPRV
uniref:cytoplasmic polyadenylation element-binding protein 1-B-like n=1 Tax=Myxine glutinosa TaxID=7769 RepID=UPI0035900408